MHLPCVRIVRANRRIVDWYRTKKTKKKSSERYYQHVFAPSKQKNNTVSVAVSPPPISWDKTLLDASIYPTFHASCYTTTTSIAAAVKPRAASNHALVSRIKRIVEYDIIHDDMMWLLKCTARLMYYSGTGAEDDMR